jgi:hypothetical protein
MPSLVHPNPASECQKAIFSFLSDSPPPTTTSPPPSGNKTAMFGYAILGKVDVAA